MSGGTLRLVHTGHHHLKKKNTPEIRFVSHFFVNVWWTFFGTKFFRYRFRDFFRHQIFSIPIPRLFSVPNFSDTGSDTIKKREQFPGTGIPGTGTSHSGENHKSASSPALENPLLAYLTPLCDRVRFRSLVVFRCTSISTSWSSLPVTE